MQSDTASMSESALSQPRNDGNDTTTSTTTPLLDLPLAWLHQLVNNLDPAARLALFSTCTTLRNTLLQTHPRTTLRLKLPLPQQRMAGAQACLMLVGQQLTAGVTLVLQGTSPEFMDDTHTHLLLNAAAAAAVAGGGGGDNDSHAGVQPCVNLSMISLSGIRTVELQAMYLNHLVPPWLSQAFPNLTSLHLNSCDGIVCNLACPVSCPTLRQLALTGKSRLRLVQSYGSASLDVLKGLESLTVSCGALDLNILQTSSHLQSHLTAIALTDMDWRYTLHEIMPVHAAVQYRHVQHLCLVSYVIRDEDMEVLYSFPVLKQLHCASICLRLQHCLVDRPFNHLEQLSLDVLHIHSMMQMCLTSITTIHLCGDHRPAPDGCRFQRPSHLDTNSGINNPVNAVLVVVGAAPLQDVQRVIATLQQRCQLATGHTHVHIQANAGVPSECVAAVLSLLSVWLDVTKLTIECATITCASLEAVRVHLRSHPALDEVMLSGCCFHSAVWPLILPSLPPRVHTLGLCRPLGFLVEDFVSMCEMACRPITLKRAWEPGWWERVQAVQGCGSKFVTLSGL